LSPTTMNDMSAYLQNDIGVFFLKAKKELRKFRYNPFLK